MLNDLKCLPINFYLLTMFDALCDVTPSPAVVTFFITFTNVFCHVFYVFNVFCFYLNVFTSMPEPLSAPISPGSSMTDTPIAADRPMH